LYQILAEHTGKPLKQITKDADRDFWMCAEDAVKYGIVDEVLRKTKK
jgi:ATP-dependent Clp protease protease subunit